ncbi:MAG: hypothetical protein IT162_03940 [Bryobacterales bacterium]|nr:hypothetical protein [Bryobacterales bacterium]
MAAKRIDRSFKVFGDKDTHGLVYLFSGVPLDAKIEIEAVDRDLALPGLLVDNAYLVRGLDTSPGGRIFHLECELRWHGGIPRDSARYVQALDLKYELPVDSTLVLLKPRGFPAAAAPPPTPFCCRRGALRMEVHYRIVKVWEMDPAQALDVDRPALLPWALLMRPTRTQVRETARRLARTGDHALISQFLALGGLNPDYARFELLEFLGRETMYLKREILEASRFIQGLKQEFRKEAREEVELELLRGIAADRFPGLETSDITARGKALNALVRAVASAPSRRAAQALLNKARRKAS